MKKNKKREEVIKKGEVRVINGKKVLVLPCVEPEYTAKKKRTGKGSIAKRFKNNG